MKEAIRRSRPTGRTRAEWQSLDAPRMILTPPTVVAITAAKRRIAA